MAEEAPSKVTRVIGRGKRAVRTVRRCAVQVLSGRKRGERTAIEKPLYRIGSHPSNDLVLPDETVSKHHLEVRAEPAGYRLVDLDSSNGTFFGSARLGELLVVEPLDLAVGAVRLHLEPQAAEAEVPTSNRERFGRLQGRSPAMRELFEQLEAVAQSDCAVLLEGEVGVGKELVARSLHEESGRKSGPWVPVDCGALSAAALEAQLFGQPSLLEEADRGTLFLGEIGELPPGLQAQLQSALERRRVGGRKVDLRVVAATSRDLPREVNGGRFRAELFFRLAVVRVRVPPLRERLEDLPTLVEELLGELRLREGDRVPKELSAVTLARLASRPWPGNLRELRGTVEQAVLALRPAAAPAAPPFNELRERFLVDFELRYLKGVLTRTAGDLAEAARQAGLDRHELQKLLHRHGI